MECCQAWQWHPRRCGTRAGPARGVRRALSRARRRRLSLFAVGRPRPGGGRGRHADDVPERVPRLPGPAGQAAGMAAHDRAQHLLRALPPLAAPAAARPALRGGRDHGRRPGRRSRGRDLRRVPGHSGETAGGAAPRGCRRPFPRGDRKGAGDRRDDGDRPAHAGARQPPSPARRGHVVRACAAAAAAARRLRGARGAAPRGDGASAQLRALRGRGDRVSALALGAARGAHPGFPLRRAAGRRPAAGRRRRPRRRDGGRRGGRNDRVAGGARGQARSAGGVDTGSRCEPCDREHAQSTDPGFDGAVEGR